MTKGKSDAPDTRALYRKYRSKSLSEVVGQTHITDILMRALERGKVAHAYLFTGPRGVGKTSVARILAHEINKLPYDESTQHPDIIEIDAASNRRIDDIRDLRDKVQITPVAAKYKVYIIDEVHMLTGESFNAFLKTLEEPPAHVVFILATTDAHKLPVTITSRTQRFAFRSIAPDAAKEHLRAIADAEKIAIEDDALALIVEHGEGSFRDSISLLDQLSSLTDGTAPITAQLIEQVLGMAEGSQIEAILSAYRAHDTSAITQILTQLEQQGIAPSITAGQLIRTIRGHIAAQPELLDLLENLTEVPASARPDIKLLTALLPRVAPSKVVATAVAPPELKPLEREATKPRPSEARIRSAVAQETKAVKTEQKPEATAVQAKQEPPAAEQPPAPTAQETVAAKPKGDPVEFDWNSYIAHLKEHHIALASILAKCKAESDGTALTIYTGTAFWKKKLDDTRYQPILHDTLATLNMGDLTIETIPTTMPPKDSQAAAVAAIMGGGEEVEL